MTAVWQRFPASGSTLLAMLALADWCNDDGGSLHPSLRAVADKIRVSEKQARRTLRGLEESGYLSVLANAQGGRPGTTKQLRLNVAKLMALPPLHPPVMRPGQDTPPIAVPDPSHPGPNTPPMGGSQDTMEPTKNQQRAGDNSAPIGFNGLAFQPLSAAQQAFWRNAYPGVNVPQEFLRAAAWLVANPQMRKADYRDFLHRWLLRAQDRASGVVPSLTEKQAQMAEVRRALYGERNPDGRIGHVEPVRAERKINL